MNSNQFTNTAYNTFKYGVIILLTALVNISVFTAGFKFSIAVICFAVFLFVNRDFPCLQVTCFCTLGIILLRIMTDLSSGEVHISLTDHLPEGAFYLFYGLILSIYSSLKTDYREHLKTAFALLAIIDYLGNTFEMLIREPSGLATQDVQLALIGVAIFRSAVAVLVMIFLKQYGDRLINTEREERYNRLILLTSRLDNELRWLKKSSDMIEETMNTSYTLYHQLQNGHDPDHARTALSIAGNIHDIKKEYLLILRGISETIDTELQNDGMDFSEVCKLLEYSIGEMIKDQQIQLAFTVTYENDFYTRKHYALLSVIYNLCTNAVEASDDGGTIEVLEQQHGDDYVFTVTNHGAPIPEENRDEIFNAGFSTKINFTTGEISRGLGLNLVKDIVYNDLNGTVTFTSDETATTFTVSIPMNNLMSED